MTTSGRNRKPLLIFLFATLICLFSGNIGIFAYSYYSSTEKFDFSLLGPAYVEMPLEESLKDPFIDPGFKASYCALGYCSDLSEKVVVKNSVKNSSIGEYRIFYSLDFNGKIHQLQRIVKIVDNAPPELTILGDESVGLYVGESFEDSGATATDNSDGDLTEKITTSGEVDTSKAGVYKITYSVSDSSGNSIEKDRFVFVYETYAFQKTPTRTFDDLIQYINDNGWDIALGFENLDNHYSYVYRDSDTFYGASLVKAIDALYVYEKMTPDASLKSLVRGAITYSNNNSHISLVNHIGYQNLKSYGEALGMTHILNGSAVYSDTYYFNDTDVKDQMIILKKLWQLVNDLENGTELKNYFINNFWDNLRFKNSPTHLYKNGLYGKYYHEIGIMLADSPYAVVILTTEGNRWNCTRIIRDLSHRIYMLNDIYSTETP